VACAGAVCAAGGAGGAACVLAELVPMVINPLYVERINVLSHRISCDVRDEEAADALPRPARGAAGGEQECAARGGERTLRGKAAAKPQDPEQQHQHQQQQQQQQPDAAAPPQPQTPPRAPPRVPSRTSVCVLQLRADPAGPAAAADAQPHPQAGQKQQQQQHTQQWWQWQAWQPPRLPEQPCASSSAPPAAFPLSRASSTCSHAPSLPPRAGRRSSSRASSAASSRRGSIAGGGASDAAPSSTGSSPGGAASAPALEARVREQVEAAVTAALAARIRPLLALVAAERAEVKARAAELARREKDAAARERLLALREGAPDVAVPAAEPRAAGGRAVRWAPTADEPRAPSLGHAGRREVYISDSGSACDDGLLPVETRCCEVTDGGGGGGAPGGPLGAAAGSSGADGVEAFVFTYSDTTGHPTNERLAPVAGVAAVSPVAPRVFAPSRLGLPPGGSRLAYAGRPFSSGGGSGSTASGGGAYAALQPRRHLSAAAAGMARWRHITSGSGRILKRSSSGGGGGRARRAAAAAAAALPPFAARTGSPPFDARPAPAAAPPIALARSYSDPLQQISDARAAGFGPLCAAGVSPELYATARRSFCYGRTCDVLERQHQQPRRKPAAWR
jgi:hypothetical protein